MYCSKCGKEVKEDFNVCPYCENKINNIQEEKIENNIEKNNNSNNKIIGILIKIVGALLIIDGIRRLGIDIPRFFS